MSGLFGVVRVLVRLQVGLVGMSVLDFTTFPVEGALPGGSETFGNFYSPPSLPPFYNLHNFSYNTLSIHTLSTPPLKTSPIFPTPPLYPPTLNQLNLQPLLT